MWWIDVAKPLQLDFDNVDAVIRNGAQEVSWVQQEFGGIDLGDKRLNRRLIKTTQLLAASPLSPINEACSNWASTRAAYRMFDNSKVTPKEILKPHIDETAKRIAGCDGPVLVAQDTVFFSYGSHPNTKGLGPIGKSNDSRDRGLIMHNALAFTTTGVPLGILSQRIWARKDVPDESKAQKIERLRVTSLDEKESAKWITGLKDTVKNAPPGAFVVTIADRESDFFEFIDEAKALSALFLIRARADRNLDAEENDGSDKISEAVNSAPILGSMTIEIPGNGKRKARRAEVEVRSVEISVKPPQRRGKAKETAGIESITINVVSATEKNPPDGENAISWVLLTNLPVKCFSDAKEKVEWYAKRWGIETWHKVLKSGCKVEHCLLETADRLKRYLTLFSIIGVQLMNITYFARVAPDTPSTDIFSQEEIEALNIRVKRQQITKGDPPTIKEAVQMIASLGGHLGRSSDGYPGMTVMWRGMFRFYESVEMYSAIKTITGLKSE